MTGLQMKFGLAMDLPEDKRAGYYAQIVKALAGKASLFDRDKELLIFSTPQEREQAKPIMNQYSVPCEEFDLLLLPSTVRMSPSFEDYGFITRLENAYLYADMAVVCKLNKPEEPSSRAYEPEQAAAQLEEHLLAYWSSDDDGAAVYTLEKQHAELAEGIARAYGCSVEWICGP
ncbi:MULTISPECIES: hypothetical protein [Paenibacillus]|uniref:Uncharacterized protein n=1 Tax=Paenibacillus naphthalenovorans TaxID=162209 RepID=A0A0U2VYI0_9BACL|nr:MULTISPECIES: hypothetical protein [Paenibacillus]ALS21348.1 hypothetical protein IJ22_09660 [Paenibacillus naphthalenovorans]NTZ18491.1 hypothetical protein [Paenibacillus sp. JMULE4]SDH96088.1 hypothetical protein SAMN05421868_10249 [Paenibacillus naphthalenovorans]